MLQQRQRRRQQQLARARRGRARAGCAASAGEGCRALSACRPSQGFGCQEISSSARTGRAAVVAAEVWCGRQEICFHGANGCAIELLVVDLLVVLFVWSCRQEVEEISKRSPSMERCVVLLCFACAKISPSTERMVVPVVLLW
jgi:hypothetical protein